MTTPIAPDSAPSAARKKNTGAMSGLLSLGPQRRTLDRLGQQHLLGEDEIGAGVVRHLVVVAHGDGIERARDLAVAAEDAAAQVDLVHGGVALAGGHAVHRRVLGRHHADAVSRARRGTERAADALLKARVLKAVELVAAAEAGIDGRLLLRVLNRGRPFDDPRERGLQTPQRLAERAVRAGRRSRGGPADDFDHVFAGVVAHDTTRIAVTSTLRVASGSSTFHPNDISWS